MQLNTNFLRFVLFIRFLSLPEAWRKYCLVNIFLSRTLFFPLTLDRVWPGLMHSFIPHFDRHTNQLEFQHFCALTHTALSSSSSHRSSNSFSELGPVISSLDYFCTSWWVLSPSWSAVWFPHVWGQFQQVPTDYIRLSKHTVMCWNFFSTTHDFHMCTSVSHTKYTPLATEKPKTQIQECVVELSYYLWASSQF